MTAGGVRLLRRAGRLRRGDLRPPAAGASTSTASPPPPASTSSCWPCSAGSARSTARLLGAFYFNLTRYFLHSPLLAGFVGSGGTLLLLYVAPGGLVSVMAKLRDACLRIVAQRRQMVVPSLFADYDPEALERRLIPLAEASGNSGLAALPPGRASACVRLYRSRRRPHRGEPAAAGGRTARRPPSPPRDRQARQGRDHHPRRRRRTGRRRGRAHGPHGADHTRGGRPRQGPRRQLRQRPRHLGRDLRAFGQLRRTPLRAGAHADLRPPLLLPASRHRRLQLGSPDIVADLGSASPRLLDISATIGFFLVFAAIAPRLVGRPPPPGAAVRPRHDRLRPVPAWSPPAPSNREPCSARPEVLGAAWPAPPPTCRASR